MRIGILGGGAAGLAAAHALRRAGHPQVTVLERARRVGGKCSTFMHQGRSYELGAGALTSAYSRVKALLAEQGVHATAGFSGVHIDLDAGKQRWTPPLSGWFRAGVESLRFAAWLAGERSLARPGFDRLPDPLRAPFSEWAREHGFGRVGALIEPWFTGFGYGYLDEVPAAYVLKYARLFRAPIYELLDGGYQGLWERVARGLDVRLGVEVSRIERADHVVVETSAERFEFDALILACPLDDVVAVLDAGDEERALFSRIRWNDYHVIAAEVDGAPNARYGFFSAHLKREHAGAPVFFYRRWLDRLLVLFYCAPPPDVSLDASEAALRATVARLGATIRRVELRHAWRYFPHVDAADLRSGFYERLERLQGQRHTFYTGELLAFTAVECVVAYSQSLVERMLGRD